MVDKRENRVAGKSSFFAGAPRNTYYFLLAAIVLLTIISYSNSLNNKFVNWDDNEYIVNNPLIKDISPKGLVEIFKSFTKDQLPLTQLSLAVNYHFSQLEEMSYHVVNLIFHILNILLVFQFIKIVTKRHEVALIAALLFAIHPMRVESVSWASERKDVQFTFFYLLSLITYLNYLKSDYKVRFLIFSIFLSLLSYLSKFMAASIPAVLILIDFYYQRKISVRSLLEKVPFIIIPLISGIIHYTSATGYTMVSDIIHKFSFIDSIFLASYSLIFYLFKFLLPVKIYALYPYPIKINGFLPVEYYLSLIIIIILVLLFIKYYKTLITKGREVFFGILFFLLNIYIVVQIFHFGGRCITADRYTYVPYIGLFLIIGKIFVYITDSKTKLANSFKPFLIYIVLGISLIFAFQTFNRNKVWFNSMTLWNDVIEKNPNVAVAYADRGKAKCDMGDFKGAIEDYDKAIDIERIFPEAYYNRGLNYFKINQYGSAISDYNNAIKFGPNYLEAYYNRGLAYFYLKQYDKAIKDYTKTLEINSDYEMAIVNRGVVYYELQQFDKALTDFNKAIESDPKLSEAYYNRGRLFFSKNHFDLAISDYNKAISLNIKYLNAYKNLGRTYFVMNKYNEAIYNFSKVISLSESDVLTLLFRGLSYYNTNQTEFACKDWARAKELGNEDAGDLIVKYCQ